MWPTRQIDCVQGDEIAAWPARFGALGRICGNRPYRVGIEQVGPAVLFANIQPITELVQTAQKSVQPKHSRRQANGIETAIPAVNVGRTTFGFTGLQIDTIRLMPVKVSAPAIGGVACEIG